MKINRKLYFLCWELKQCGMNGREIGDEIGFSGSRANQIIRYVEYWCKRKIVPKELRELMMKYEINDSTDEKKN